MLFLKNPGDRDPLWILRNCLQGSLDCAVSLIQVVIDDGEVKVVTIGCLHFCALVAHPVQFFILRQKTCYFVLMVLIRGISSVYRVSIMCTYSIQNCFLQSVSWWPHWTLQLNDSWPWAPRNLETAGTPRMAKNRRSSALWETRITQHEHTFSKKKFAHTDFT